MGHKMEIQTFNNMEVINLTMEWAWDQDTDMEDQWDRTKVNQCHLTWQITDMVNKITVMDILKIKTLVVQEVQHKMVILSLTIMVQTMVKCSNKEVPIEKLTIDNKFSNIKINNIHSNKELKAQITTNKEVQTNSTKTK